MLSRKRKYFSTREIIKSLKKKGAKPIYIYTPKVKLLIKKSEMDLLSRGRSLRNLDSVIPRIGRSLTNFGYMVIKQFEMLNVPTTLSSHALVTCRNKFLALQILSARGLPVPPTWLIASRIERDFVAEEIPYPIVLKLLSGTQGVGVMRVADRMDSIPIIDALYELDQIICIQKFLKNPGEDIRVFIVDGQVLAAMKRIAPPGEWRCNFHTGAKVEAYKLNTEEEEITIQAAKALDACIAGVDIIQAKDGPYLIEVNVSPGFEGLLSATEINAADAIADYAIKIGKR
ncbi:MAG: RimK family alpha-L-glutamate ligase [Candidatus Bathyarchaeia archaeon]